MLNNGLGATIPSPARDCQVISACRASRVAGPLQSELAKAAEAAGHRVKVRPRASKIGGAVSSTVDCSLKLRCPRAPIQHDTTVGESTAAVVVAAGA